MQFNDRWPTITIRSSNGTTPPIKNQYERGVNKPIAVAKAAPVTTAHSNEWLLLTEFWLFGELLMVFSNIQH